MLFVLFLALVLWGLGLILGASRQARLVMLGVLIGAVLVIQVALPAAHPLRVATGGDVRLWLLVIAGLAIAAVYRAGLRWLRARARPAPVAAPAAVPEEEAAPDRTAPFAEAELTRYARHIILKEIGGPGQRRLKEASVLVVGAGGLGAPALQYLAASGVGRIAIADGDVVEETNLQRQVIHTEAMVGRPKVESAAAALRALNRHVEVVPIAEPVTEENAADLIAGHDLVLDGTDSFATRYAVNAACVAARVPLIGAALTPWEGQISLWHPAAGGPCYRCVFPEAPAADLVPSCAVAGVAAPLPGILGAMMAMEAVKLLTGAGETLLGRLMIYDGLYAESRVIRVQRRTECPVCGEVAAAG
ncbi:HesA/MoeB/ThiF family protein [Pseudoroseicyclus tamaricis]|uniref:Molybdopterin-synthase adenylyltransferase n=1 Tax=Pseudoroseicyclus tamaricis TaxID=2705421 RepID=A0A6B2JU36_9RHOB|nr:molybdopterin-synthase adenylyltransferase MoeB [Pseudoroseicyclus tamaricis]NDV00119.1 molybdopterin-synthase adenylyltransferase MoeB [Pseudoroseicyclus tamaricis]